MKQITNMMPY